MIPTLNLPKVRELFIPEPDHVILECDLSGADAQVTAHECGGRFASDFFSGVKMHVVTMQEFFPAQFAIDPKHEPEYTRCKNLMYGTIYVGGPATISAESGAPLSIVKKFQPYLFNRYPEIKSWQEAKIGELYQKGGVGNAFGYRIYYQERLETMVPEAVSWVPSSTVAEVCFRGAKAVRRAALAGEFPAMTQQFGANKWFRGARLQVHDSLNFMFPKQNWPDYAIRIREILHSISVPYSTYAVHARDILKLPFSYPEKDLTIPWTMKASARSWGHCEEVDWNTLELAA